MKIGDFGISKHIYEKTNQILKGFGAIIYTDPEYLRSREYKRDKKSDVYSLGMLFWEISSGRIPFGTDSLDGNLALEIIDGKREKIVEGTPLKYINIYTGILT